MLSAAFARFCRRLELTPVSEWLLCFLSRFTLALVDKSAALKVMPFVMSLASLLCSSLCGCDLASLRLRLDFLLLAEAEGVRTARAASLMLDARIILTYDTW